MVPTSARRRCTYASAIPASFLPAANVKNGEGVSVCFICEDALGLYTEFCNNGLSPAEPFVGNGMWVVSICDADGYSLHFESVTDVPEETLYSTWLNEQ